MCEEFRADATPMPLSEAELSAHDALARAFIRHLRDMLPAGADEEHPATGSGDTDVLVARIPAATPAIGDVSIHSDGSELTTFVGDHTHHHTGAYLFGKPNDPAAIESAAAAAAAWLQDLLEDRVVVWSRRDASGKVLAGGTEQLDEAVQPRLGPWRRYATEAWLWSGRSVSLASSDEPDG